jgi:predicted MPP superfamily phosphohydrolase
MLHLAETFSNIIPPGLLFIIAPLFAYGLWQSSAGNRKFSRWAALAALVFGFSDWLMLFTLPRLNLSYGAVNPSWFLFLTGRLLVLVCMVGALKGWYRLNHLARTHRTAVGAFALWGIINIAGSIVAFDALYIEPFRLQVTRISLAGPAFLTERPLRILHITDTHIERITRRERGVLAQAEAIQPDLIVLTGDYVNMDFLNDPVAIRETHAFYAGLHAPYGIYAVAGSVESPTGMRDLFEGLPVTILDDAAARVPFDDLNLYILGITLRQDGSEVERLHALESQVPPGAYTVLLYHKPDLIEAAAQAGIDLYFAGHTHGGQIQLPFIGPIVTLSVYGRKYAEGLHSMGPTTLYTSHGLGMEGFGLPRARLLCPPEIVVIELGK